MRRRLALLVTAVLATALPSANGDGPTAVTRPTGGPNVAAEPRRVGPLPDGGGTVVPTDQLVRPAGRTVAFAGRPVDLAIAPGGRVVYAKDNRGLVVLDAAEWAVRQELKFPVEGGGSMFGIVVTRDGRRVWATGAGSTLFEGLVQPDGTVKWGRSIALPGRLQAAEDNPADQGRQGESGERPGATRPATLTPTGAEKAAGAEKAPGAGKTPGAEKRDDEAEPDPDDAAERKPAAGVRPRAAPRRAAAPATRKAAAAKRSGSYPCGITLSADEATAYVCLSANNALAVVDLTAGKMTAEVPVGVAPYAVALSPDGRRAYVSNWGGRRAVAGDLTAKSAGTDTVVDARGVASTGTVGVVDTAAKRQAAEVPVGLHPAGLALTRDGKLLYIANANSDTVSVIDTTAVEQGLAAAKEAAEKSAKAAPATAPVPTTSPAPSAVVSAVRRTVLVRPDPNLPFGSAANAVALSPDERTLYVAVGGNNAVAVVDLGGGGAAPAGTVAEPRAAGFIPAGWYPGAVACVGDQVVVANVKGEGSRNPAKPAAKAKKLDGWNTHDHRGSVSRVARPDAETLAAYTARVRADARVPEALAALERAEAGVPSAVVPDRSGGPSPIEHVVYVIKENRTYDQVFGDVAKGNGDPKLCIFGREVTPNHHALAERFVLLDNFYCNGVLSADGHQWVTEGHAADYLEKSFGGWTRSYPFPGDDPLAFVSTGFIWDAALLRGLSFRNFGEMTTSKPVPAKATFTEIYQDHLAKAGKITFAQKTSIDALRRYSQPDYPGWNLVIPDAVRADVFLREFAAFETAGRMPNLTIVYLPNDHTRGTTPGVPTPAAMVADNDLALGRVVEAISKSPFWPKTCVFVVEDDPQNGFDHVDGHRSLCLVASPYAKRGAVVSDFYNQTSVLRTMGLMLGLSPLNQMDALAPPMRACFAAESDLKPYVARKNNVPLDQLNPKLDQLKGQALKWAKESVEQPVEQPDMIDEDDMNRILWHAARGDDVPYPKEWAGAHGRGLAKLGLTADPRAPANGKDDDD